MRRGVPRNSQETKDEVSAFLKGRPGLAFCDDCLRKVLNISRYHLSEKGISETAAAARLVREWDTCIICGKRRVITKATNPKSGRKKSRKPHVPDG